MEGRYRTQLGLGEGFKRGDGQIIVQEALFVQ
jgi:hypothetical protein